jgi:hypothetical protein
MFLNEINEAGFHVFCNFLHDLDYNYLVLNCDEIKLLNVMSQHRLNFYTSGIVNDDTILILVNPQKWANSFIDRYLDAGYDKIVFCHHIGYRFHNYIDILFDNELCEDIFDSEFLDNPNSRLKNYQCQKITWDKNDLLKTQITLYGFDDISEMTRLIKLLYPCG